jgi:hypothetical protein
MGNKGLKKSFSRHAPPADDAGDLEVINSIFERMSKHADGFHRGDLWQLISITEAASLPVKLSVLKRLDEYDVKGMIERDATLKQEIGEDKYNELMGNLGIFREGLERASELHDRINSMYGTISRLHDPEYGPVGAAVVDKLKEHGDAIHYKAVFGNTANYHAFIYPLTIGKPSNFFNTFVFGKKTFEKTPARMLVPCCHETSHFIENNENPVMHLSPFNGSSKYILSPRSWMKLVEYTESRAYAFQAWMASLSDDPEVFSDPAPGEDKDVVSPRAFQELRREHGLKNALVLAAEKTMGATMRVKDPEWKFRDHYHKMALSDFVGSENIPSNLRIEEIVKGKIKDIVFVELDDDDILSLGDWMLGPGAPNIFGEEKLDERWKAPLKIASENLEKLEKLEKDLGIAGQKLPGFGEALSADNMTREEFFDCSLTGRKPTPGKYVPISRLPSAALAPQELIAA